MPSQMFSPLRFILYSINFLISLAFSLKFTKPSLLIYIVNLVFKNPLNSLVKIWELSIRIKIKLIYILLK